MKSTTNFRIGVAGLLVPLLLAGCFTSSPQRSEGESGSGQPGSTGSVSLPSPSSGGNSGQVPQPPGSGKSSSSGASAPGSTSSAPDSSSTPSSSSTGARTGQKGSDGRLEGKEGGEDGASDIRVATAERPGAGTDSPDAPVADAGSDSGGADGRDVSAAEALEVANAAVDAAAEAVGDAEATIERAREAVLSDSQGSGNKDSFDPWVTPGSGQETSSGSPPGGNDAAADEEADQPAGGQSGGEESFDPFADYSDDPAGQSGQRSRQQVNAGSLQIADDALATANSALNRARRSLIEAAVAGSGDADAEAVQLAAARAALEAAAEAVVASAIAVIAASASVEPTGEPVTDPEEIQRAMEEFAAGLAMVVGVLHREMTNAADALEATADLLKAAGSLIAMVGQADLEPRDEDDDNASAGERVASLDNELEESLAVFDDRMSAEGSASDPGLSDGDTAFGTADAGAADDPGFATGSANMPGSAGEGWDKGDRPVSRRDGEWARRNRTADASKPEPAESENLEEFVIDDEGVAQDDDIIARQLREAAAAETDPELRDRLWEEYYAYKESLEQGEADTTQ